MAAPDMQTATFQNTFLPALLQSLLSEICSRAVLALVHRSPFLKDSSSNNAITRDHHPAETRPSDVNSKWIQECTARTTTSNIDEEKDSSEKCRVSVLHEVPAPEMADRIPRQQFSEWLLVAKKDDEDEDEDEDEDDDDEADEDDDEEGDDKEGDDEEVGGDGAGAGDGEDDDEEDEANDDDDDEDEDDEDEDEDDDDDDDESPPKKLRK